MSRFVINLKEEVNVLTGENKMSKIGKQCARQQVSKRQKIPETEFNLLSC